jgi:hypothetical protein
MQNLEVNEDLDSLNKEIANSNVQIKSLKTQKNNLKAHLDGMGEDVDRLRKLQNDIIDINRQKAEI